MQFADTRWSLVMRAGLDTEDGRTALNSLCESYIGPLNAFLRRAGYGPDAAEDLTQSFFVKLLQGNFVRAAEQSKGRFRTYLLTALKRSVANDLRDQSRIKRGGRVQLISLDATFESEHPEAASSGAIEPDRQFDRDWALDVLDKAIDALEEQYGLDGKSQVFQTLVCTLSYDWQSSDREAACRRLDVTRSHLRVLIARFRADFRVSVRRVIMDTVVASSDVDDEIQELMKALSGR